MDDGNLRELKKQTQILAEKPAANGAALLFFIGFFGLGWLGVTGWPLLFGALACAIVGYVLTFKAYTE